MPRYAAVKNDQYGADPEDVHLDSVTDALLPETSEDGDQHDDKNSQSIHFSVPPFKKSSRSPNRPYQLHIAVGALVLVISFLTLAYDKSAGERSIAHSSIVVGPRSTLPNHHQHCSSSQFLEAISRATVAPNGTAQDLPANFSVDPADFAFSFDFPKSCNSPHVYSAAEACELVSAFGGIYLRGDSLVRMVVNALLIILTGRADGAVKDPSEICRGDDMFDDRPATCRTQGRFTYGVGSGYPVDACSGAATINFKSLPCPWHPFYLNDFEQWKKGLHYSIKALSPVVIQSHGLHCRMLPSVPLFGGVKPMISHVATAFPRPLLLWLTIHAPGPKKPTKYLSEQGPDAVRRYNQVMAQAIGDENSGSTIEGGMGVVDWFAMTFGAKSYDGTHYGYQINMEKAHLLLNYLDLIWNEVVAGGALWDTEKLCPLGSKDYFCPPPSAM